MHRDHAEKETKIKELQERILNLLCEIESQNETVRSETENNEERA